MLLNLKFIVGIGFLLAVFMLIAYQLMKDAPKNNLRRAKKHHRLAEKNYNNGHSYDAEEHYELSNHYRETAEKQIKGEI
ncbi:MAG: hypothetical protein KKF44_02470 [Nanoarchaeota archaeon]|nr:hypothetical protein [Nanoarchaeota archaeon]